MNKNKINLEYSLRWSFNYIRGHFGWWYKSFRGEVDPQYMSSLRRSDSLDILKLKEVQWTRLKALIRHAYDTVPFYRKEIRKFGIHPTRIQDPDDFAKLPILTKTHVRERQKDLISTKYEVQSLSATQTGGSTGEPVKVYLNKRRIRLETTDQIWANQLSGWRIGEPVGYLWGAPEVAPPVHPFRQLARRHLLNPGFLTKAYDLNTETFMNFIAMYRRWRPTLVIGYASSLRALSEFLIHETVKLFSPKAVISSAELLDENTRQLIQKAFGCPVIDRYGSREVGLIACQCIKGRFYHLNMHRVYLEIVSENGKDAGLDKSGKILVTDLANFGMPIIRYEIGDVGRWSPQKSCTCSRQSDCLTSIEGRTFDFLVTSDGKKIHGLCFNRDIFSIPGISQYRLVQESPTLVTVQVVQNDNFHQESITSLQHSIKEKLGSDVLVRFEPMDRLPKTPSGKIRYIECKVPLDKHAALLDPPA